MRWTVVAFLFCLSGFASSVPISPPIPVASAEPGIRHLPSEPQPKVTLEIFIDLNCPDSEAAWPVVKQVQQNYGTNRLNLVLQQLPLPYHRNAVLSTQGLYVIEQWTPDFIDSYVQAVLANWSQFSTSNTVNKTETQVLDELADLAVQVTGIDKSLFISDIGNHRSYTVTAWKYGVKRAVASTPTFFVNGVDIVAAQPTFDEWIAFLDPLVNSP